MASNLHPISTKRREKGFVLVVTAVASVCLVCLAGIAVDTGYMEWMRRRIQTAADSAAMAAMLDLKAGNDINTATTDGRSLASSNGFANGGNNTVAINKPPTLGSYANNSNYVESVVTANVPTFFMMVVGQNSVSIKAHAVASLLSGAGNSSAGCVYALNTSASRALQVAGSGNQLNTYCSMFSESANSTDSFEMEGSFIVGLYNSAKVGVVGNWQINNGNSLKDMPANTTAVPVHVTSPGDPLASVNPPSGVAVVKTTPTYYDMNAKPTGNTIQPGVYCGGLTVGNTNGTTYTMAAGTYVMAGGSFTLQSQAKVDATAGVSIYLTNSTGYACSGSYSFSPLTISGQVTFTQKAPTTGSLAGIAIFQDRSVGSSGSQNQINGGSTVVIDGALYFKNSKLLFSGSGTSSGYLILVADTIVFNGNSNVTINNNYSTLPGGSPIASTGSSGVSGLVE